MNSEVDSHRSVPRKKSDRAPDERLVYVDNQELERHLATRPAQYGLELSQIVVKRDENGIYIDTQSPAYASLFEKYRDYRLPARPLESRVRKNCLACPVGALCRFPRLPLEERTQILETGEGRDWCETKAWGSEVDFVYAYVQAPARGEELRFSLRSLEANFVGTPRVWIVGERPDWYQGEFLSHQRIAPRWHRPRFDQAAKLKRILKQKRIADEFVWMMDDLYFLKPFTLGELRGSFAEARFDPQDLDREAPANEWLQAKRMTFEALWNRGFPTDDTTGHMPYVYNKRNLRRLLRDFRLEKNPYVLNLLYFNVYASRLPRAFHAIHHIDSGEGTAESILERSRSALLLNHPDEGYTRAMEEALAELFPEPSRWELT